MQLAPPAPDSTQLARAAPDSTQLARAAPDSTQLARAAPDSTQLARAAPDSTQLARAAPDSTQLARAAPDSTQLARAAPDSPASLASRASPGPARPANPASLASRASPGPARPANPASLASRASPGPARPANPASVASRASPGPALAADTAAAASPRAAASPAGGAGCGVQATVAAYFGFAALKAGQREVIEHLLATGDGGGDVVCKFPTGFGKSLCYCVPALHARRLALVVSPLCSLIQDQTGKLNARCKVAYNLSSSGGAQGAARADADETLVFGDDAAAHARLAGGALLFCTPEKLACERFRARLRALHARQPFAYFVLDEAHLAAEQGYSFRGDYLKLGWLRDAFPDTRVCCFSATCNAFVSARLGELLRLRRTRLFAVDDARHNLHLSVHLRGKKGAACPCSVLGCAWGTPGASGAGVVARAVRGFAGGEVVVFANARAAVEELAGELARAAPAQVVAFYHAGLSDAERVDVQARFVGGAIDVLVATMASFGTGVDMPRVCKVVIYGVPASVHTLVQLVGRGGRAGQPYSADLFASSADVTKQHMILLNETRKLPAGTHRHYAQHLADSFALVQRLLAVAQAQTACCLHTLRAASSAVSLELRVPFAQLAQVKAVNKRVGAADAARWNPAAKRWVLPPMAPAAPYQAWHSAPAAAGVVAAPCMRCSSCKSRKRPRPPTAPDAA